MRLKILQRYTDQWGFYQGTYIFILVLKLFQFRWFTDCGEWFVYIHIGRKWWRFSGAGFIKGGD